MVTADAGRVKKGNVMKAIQAIRNFWNDEEGVTAIEYGLIAALIAVVIITAVTAVGTNLETTFNTIKDALAGTAAPAP